MTQVDRTIGVRQGAGNQYSSFRFAHNFVFAASFQANIFAASFRANSGRRNYGTPTGQAVASGARFTD